MVSFKKELLERVRKRCIKVIRNNFVNGAFLAGTKIHRDWWSWDNLEACLALANLGFDREISSIVDFFLKYQDKDGLTPLRVENSSHSLRFFGIEKKHSQAKPVYRSSQPFFPGRPLAGNALLVIITDLVAPKMSLKWLKHRLRKIKKIFSLMQNQSRDNLIPSGRASDWDENITFKSGYTLYANVLYSRAALAMANIFSLIGQKNKAEEMKTLSCQIKAQIQDKFWQGDYFIDWLSFKKKPFSHFDTFGNLLAVLLNVADAKKAKKIEKFICDHKIDQPPCLQKYPSLAFPHNIINELLGFTYKIRRCCWPWLGGFDIAAKVKTGFLKEAKKELLELASIFDKLGPIETINPKKEPINGFFSHSERDFTLSAASFLYALESVFPDL